MGSVNRYLLYHFTTNFLSLFGTLWLIISITFFIKISKITSIVQVSFYELGKLYFFILPEIFLYTLPFSFFISLALALFRLSKENETIVLFTLGFKPIKISIFFGFLAFILSALLLVNSLIFIPLSDQLNKNFIDFKKSEAKLNIKPSESGQRFSDWMVFVNKSEDTNNSRVYKDIILYQLKNDKNQEKVIISDGANLNNSNGELSLDLKRGSAYIIDKNSIHKAEYSKMTIRTVRDEQLRSIGSIIEYWKQIKTSERRAKHFAIYMLVSLFPLCTYLFAISFGIVTYRYQKNEIYGYIFAVIFAYFALIAIFVRPYPIASIILIFTMFFLFSIKYFHKKILSFY